MMKILMVVLALAATAPQAQETKAGGPAELPPRHPLRERQPPFAAASRSTPEPRPPEPGRSPGARDGGSDADTAMMEVTSRNDYIISTYLQGGAPVTRNYQAPPSGARKEQGTGWARAPYVKSVTRCLHTYIFQVVSRSVQAWVVERARLEGPKGEVFRVVALYPGTTRRDEDVNVVVAAAPPGARLSKVRFHLSGQDGRVAQFEARELP